jgi:hypothetical protein
MGYWDEAQTPDEATPTDYWSSTAAPKKPKEPSFSEKAGSKAGGFVAEHSDSPVLGRIVGAGVETALEDPTQLGQGALRGAWMQGSAELGRETSKLTEPYIGKVPARLTGAAVSGATIPTPGVGTLARAGYGVASAVGEDIAAKFTDNPYIKLAAGFVLPFVASKGAMALVGSGDIIGGAEEARTEAEEENAAAQEKFAKEGGGAIESAGKAADKARAETETANEKAASAKTKLEKQTTEELAPQAKTAAVEQATGRTAAQSEAEVTMGQSPERIERNQQFRDNTVGPLRRWRDDWAVRRDAVLEPIKDEHTEAPELLQAMQEQKANAGPSGIVSGKIKSLYKRAAIVAGSPEDIEIFGGALTEDDIAQMEPEKQAFYQGLLEDTKATRKPKVSDLITLQADANAVVRSSKGIERHQALAVSRGIDETLAEIDPSSLGGDVPSPIVSALKSLNGEYRDHRVNFPYKFEDAISNAARPVDAARVIFDEPQRALDIYQNGTPEEQSALKRLYADAAHTDPKFVDTATHGKFLKQAFPNTIFDSPRPWITLPDKEVSTAQVIGSSPEVAEQFSKRIDAALAQEASKYSMADPQQAAQRAAIESLMDNPPSAPELRDPRQAALQAIADQKLAKGASTSLSALKNRFLRYAGVSIGLGVGMGRVSPGIAGLGAISGLELLRMGIQRGFQQTLAASPKLAEAYYMAMTKPSSGITQSILAKGIAAAAIADVTGRAAEPEPKPSDVINAPAVKAGPTEVRVGTPGETHADIERRMPEGKTERGFIDKTGKFINRKDATGAFKAVGGDLGRPLHSGDATTPSPPQPGPVALGDSPMQKFAAAALSKVVPPPKQAILRDFDEAARMFRKGDLAQMSTREWLNKGLSPQDLVEGWRRSKMGRVESALHQLPFPAVVQAAELADNDKDESTAKRVLAIKLKHGDWQSLPPEQKSQVAPQLRRIYGPKKKEEREAAGAI